MADAVIHESPHAFGFVLEDNLRAYRDLILNYVQTPSTIVKGTVISSGGQSSHYVYFLLDGLVKISVINIYGYERILGYHKKNTLFVMDGLRREESVIVTATALTQLRAAKLSLEDLAALFEQVPRFAVDMVLYYSDVLKLMCYDAESQSSNGVRARLANFLILFMQSSDYKALGYVPFSQSELASAIGASRIQIARICGVLRNAGVIRVKKRRMEILVPDQLQQLASFQGFGK